MKRCAVLTGVTLLWVGTVWADCPLQGGVAECSRVWPAGDGPASTLDGVPGSSFAAASGKGYERLVLQGRDGPSALPQYVLGAEAADGLSPAGGALPLAAAVPASEDEAGGRGGMMTASAVPEPRGFVLVLAGLAVVVVLLSRRLRRED